MGSSTSKPGGRALDNPLDALQSIPGRGRFWGTLLYVEVKTGGHIRHVAKSGLISNSRRPSRACNVPHHSPSDIGPAPFPYSSLSKCSNLVNTTCLLVSSISPARKTSSRMA